MAILHKEKPFSLTDGQSEKIFWQNFLSRLSNDYHVITGCKIFGRLENNKLYYDEFGNENTLEPDFIVIGPKLAIIIENKNWNLENNNFEFKGQNSVMKIEIESNKKSEIKNPFSQVSRYKHIISRIQNSNVKKSIEFSTCVSFPKNTKASFQNLINSNLSNNQFKNIFDISRIIYSDDLSNNPLEVLKKFMPSNSFELSNEEVSLFISLLLPELKIGVRNSLIDIKNKLLVLSTEQEKILNNSFNYYLDLPGSGKSNILISKAIKLANDNKKILITTYSSNLISSLENIYKEKLGIKLEYYKDNISFFDIETIINFIFKSEFGEEEINFQDKIDYLKEILLNNKYKIYDYILIDEIQDFSDDWMNIIKSLVKDEKNIFMVGDISQKIFNRKFNERLIGINFDKYKLDGKYRMYRTPKKISELANTFLFTYPRIKNELEVEGYDINSISNKNIFDIKADLREQDGNISILDLVKSKIDSGIIENSILIITSKNNISLLNELFNSNNILTNGIMDNKGLLITTYEEVKGLEREIVIVDSIEDLYFYGKNDILLEFESEQIKRQEEEFSVKKIYISLTRTISDLYIFYKDKRNPFLNKLIEINNKII